MTKLDVKMEYAQSNKESKMNITKIKIECSSCDKFFILAYGGDDKPTCCPFCGSELESETSEQEESLDTESLDYDENETLYNEEEDDYMG